MKRLTILIAALIVAVLLFFQYRPTTPDPAIQKALLGQWSTAKGITMNFEESGQVQIHYPDRKDPIYTNYEWLDAHSIKMEGIYMTVSIEGDRLSLSGEEYKRRPSS